MDRNRELEKQILREMIDKGLGDEEEKPPESDEPEKPVSMVTDSIAALIIMGLGVFVMSPILPYLNGSGQLSDRRANEFVLFLILFCIVCAFIFGFLISLYTLRNRLTSRQITQTFILMAGIISAPVITIVFSNFIFGPRDEIF